MHRLGICLSSALSMDVLPSFLPSLPPILLPLSKTVEVTLIRVFPPLPPKPEGLTMGPELYKSEWLVQQNRCLVELLVLPQFLCCRRQRDAKDNS